LKYKLDLAIELRSVNIAIASATKIPKDSNQISIFTILEVFDDIPEMDKILFEIHSIAKSGVLLLVSIPNNYCYKYHVKGQHKSSRVCKFDRFIKWMKLNEFKYVKGCMKGW
jgi:hypothetical protein